MLHLLSTSSLSCNSDVQSLPKQVYSELRHQCYSVDNMQIIGLIPYIRLDILHTYLGQAEGPIL